jgi:ATP-dependent Clp protease ATP-binding subunit ClpA
MAGTASGTKKLLLRLDSQLAERLQTVAEVEGREGSGGRDNRGNRKESGMLARFGKRDCEPPFGAGRVFQRFTDRARTSLRLAQEAAGDLGHSYVGTEHLLLGLIAEGEGIAAMALASVGVEREAVRARVEEIVGRGAGTHAGPIPFTPRSKKVLELALREALHLGHNYVGTEHVLLAILTEGKGLGAQVLAEMTTDFEPMRESVREQLEAAVPKVLYAEVARLLNDRPSPLAEDLSRSMHRREQAMSELGRAFDDLERLQVENARLRDLLRRHGIDPGTATTQSA